MRQRSQDGVEGVHQFRAAAIIQRHGQAHAGISRRLAPCLCPCPRCTSCGNLIGAADDLQADVVADGWTGSSLRRYCRKQAHQKIDFRFGPPPIFQGKRVQGQRRNVQPRAGFDHGARRLHPGAVAGHARQMPPLRPAAIAVHDDGDVLRQPPRVQLLQQARLFAIGG